MEPNSSSDNTGSADNLPASQPSGKLPSAQRRWGGLLRRSHEVEKAQARSVTESDLPALPSSADYSITPDWRRPALIGYAIIILTFFVLGGWSAVARINSAVMAPGVVTLESSRKIIQHLEGGIIQQILVHEGEHVKQGQVLFKLDPTRSKASVEISRNQLDIMLAHEARLMAERDNAPKITFPPELEKRIAQPVVKDAILDESKRFTERRAALDGQVSIIKSKIKQYENQIDGIRVQKESTVQQLKYINQELTDLRDLLKKNLVQKSRVLALEREKSRLEGIIGQSIAETARAQNGIDEARLQIQQVHKKFADEVNAKIVDVRSKIADMRQKAVVSQDVLRRDNIRAPRSGTIQNIRVATIGGVIRPGEPLAELVPDDDGLVIDSHISPTDIDAVQAGMKAEIRFSAFHGVSLPIILGRVESVSRDSIADPHTKGSYFLGRIVVEEDQVPKLVKERITAGMPASVIVPTGQRSVLDYLVRPLQNRALSAFRERGG